MGTHVEIGSENGIGFRGYLARPSRTPAPSVVVLQELFGVNADMRQICDELAQQGFLALCPDLFWRQQPGVDLNVRSPDDWRTGLQLYSSFDRDCGVRDIVAAAAFASRLKGASGRVGLLGYCMGALLAFMTAARSQIECAVAFHGADTEKYLSEVPAITAPMQFHLAGEDEFMPRSARVAIEEAVSNRPDIEVFCYPGCHHAFSRHDGFHYDAVAAKLAVGRTIRFLHEKLYPAPDSPQAVPDAETRRR